MFCTSCASSGQPLVFSFYVVSYWYACCDDCGENESPPRRNFFCFNAHNFHSDFSLRHIRLHHPRHLALSDFTAAVYRAGFMYTAYGHFDASYDGAFTQHSLAGLLQFKLAQKDDLTCLVQFTTRRSFDREFNEKEDSLFAKKIGMEWYFQRLIFSWTHKFL